MTIDNIMTLAFGTLVVLLVIAALFVIIQGVRARLLFTKETPKMESTLLEMELLKARAEMEGGGEGKSGEQGAQAGSHTAASEQSDAAAGEKLAESELPPSNEAGGGRAE